MCVGIDHCSKKNCLEQERCVFPVHMSLTFKIEGPEVLGKIQLSKFACRRHRELCINERACEILGQCILDHPLVKKDKQATKQLRKQMDVNSILKIISRLMPSLNKPGKKVHGKPKS